MGVAVTEPVPVTLPSRTAEADTEAKERGVRRESDGGRGEERSGGLISTVWGTGGVWGGAVVARVGTAVILSVSTSRDETLVTVPDWTVRPVEVEGLSRTASAGGGSTGTEAEEATPPTELVLERQEPELSNVTKLLGFLYNARENTRAENTLPATRPSQKHTSKLRS